MVLVGTCDESRNQDTFCVKVEFKRRETLNERFDLEEEDEFGVDLLRSELKDFEKELKRLPKGKRRIKGTRLIEVFINKEDHIFNLVEEDWTIKERGNGGYLIIRNCDDSSIEGLSEKLFDL